MARLFLTNHTDLKAKLKQTQMTFNIQLKTALKMPYIYDDEIYLLQLSWQFFYEEAS